MAKPIRTIEVYTLDMEFGIALEYEVDDDSESDFTAFVNQIQADFMQAKSAQKTARLCSPDGLVHYIINPDNISTIGITQDRMASASEEQEDA